MKKSKTQNRRRGGTAAGERRSLEQTVAVCERPRSGTCQQLEAWVQLIFEKSYITIVLDIDAKEKQNTTHNEDLSQSSKNWQGKENKGNAEMEHLHCLLPGQMKLNTTRWDSHEALNQLVLGQGNIASCEI